MKRLTASLLPLLVAAPLAGQTMLGIRAGLNRSTVDFDEAPVGVDARMGMIVGVDAELPLAEAVSLRVGGAYAQKGFGVSEPGEGSISFKMDYLQLSALARAGTARADGLSVGVLAGPWVAFNLSCTVSFDADLEEFGSLSGSESCGAGDLDVDAMDLGVAFGVGAELAVSEGVALGLDVVYALGLKKIDDASDAPKHRSLAVQAGVVIPLGS